MRHQWRIQTVAMTAGAFLFSLSPAHAAETASPSAASAAASTNAATNPIVSRLVTIHLGRLAMKQITAIETADQITADARAYVASYGPAERDQLRDNLSLVAVVYVEHVERTVGKATTWPAGKTKAAAQAELATLNAELQKPDVDVLSVLKRANEVLAWPTGKTLADSGLDHFGRHDKLVAYAIARVPAAATLADPSASQVADASDPPQPPSDAPSDSPSGSDPIRYSCENGLGVLALYSEANDTSEASLTIDGKTYALTSAISASGAKYTSPNGMTPGRTLTWWTKGDSAMLIEAPPGGEDGPNETIVNCNDTTPQTAEDPGPDAAPGGSAGKIQKLMINSDDPKVVVTGLFRDGAAPQTEGLGSAKVTASFVMDEDGIPCDSEGYELRMSNGVIYRPQLNLCEANWTLTVPTAKPAMPSPLPLPPADLVWKKHPADGASTGGADGEPEDTNAYLAYAIPETDAFAMYGVCQKGIGRATASFPSGEGDKPSLEILTADRVLHYGFKPLSSDSVAEEGGPLYELDLSVNDQLWRLLRSGARLPYRIGNSPFMMLDASTGAEPISQFLTACEAD